MPTSPRPSRILVFGASGSGTSTLGRALAAELGLAWIDTDDIYWERTDPPFRLKREFGARRALLVETVAATDGWVVSGSLGEWGAVVVPQIELAVYVDTPTAVRMGRLRAREQARYGPRIAADGDMHEQHKAFLAWAAQYDDGPPEGRSRQKHAEWAAQLRCRLLRVDGSWPVHELCEHIVSAPST